MKCHSEFPHHAHLSEKLVCREIKSNDLMTEKKNCAQSVGACVRRS